MISLSPVLMLLAFACYVKCLPLDRDVTTNDRLIDMSYHFDNETMFYNGKKYFNMSTFFLLDTPRTWAKIFEFHSVEHGGTHIDAPNHFVPGKWAMNEIPISMFFGRAVIIDAVKEAEKNRDYEVTVDDLLKWEKQYGEIPPGAIVLTNFNWGQYWPDPLKIFGRTSLTEGPEMEAGSHHPGLHLDAAKWLLENRPDIHGIGSDCPSSDFGASTYFPVHTFVLGKNKFILENVANLSRVPNLAKIYAFPMKIGQGSTGGPIRIVAAISGVSNLNSVIFQLTAIVVAGATLMW